MVVFAFLFIATFESKTCITVGREAITNTTVTPSLNQAVKLECQRTSAFKDWFTGDPGIKVTPTEGDISTKSGQDRTLYISSFQPIHATTYSCIVDHKSNMPTVYPVVLGMFNIYVSVFSY